MKLVTFSPWQHTATSISSPKAADDIIQNFIISSSSGSKSMGTSTSAIPPSKRIKSSSSSSSSSMAMDMQPIISLTSHHQISIMGKKNSKKILRASSSSSIGDNNSKGNKKDDNLLKQVPQWIYTSRPGSKSSFFPTAATKGTADANAHNRLGTVVDPLSRTIFVLQNDNSTMKIWGLDDNINGPDDESTSPSTYTQNGSSKISKSPSKKTNASKNATTNAIVQKVQFQSPVLCMKSIPIKRQVRVKIKGSSGGEDDMNGGIAGLLTNGQMFVVLVSIRGNKRNVKVGIFGESSNSITEAQNGRRMSTRRQAKQKSPLKPAAVVVTDKHLSSTVGFIASTSSTKNIRADPGQKRKFDNVENLDNSDDEWGEVTLTTLSKDAKKNNKVTCCKHTVVISSIVDNKEVDGEYTKETGDIELQHSIYHPPKNGNSISSSHHTTDGVLVAQIDANHVSLVYQDTKEVWYATILDTRRGECSSKPFPLQRIVGSSKSISHPSIVGVGGLGNTILAVLTSDDILTVYDVSRAVKLHQMDVRSVLVKEENGTKYHFGIATDWSSGSIGITCNAVTTSSNGSKATVSMSCARVGVFDTAEEVEETAGKGAFLKSSYNLARIISSSLATANQTRSIAAHLEAQPAQFDIASLYPSVVEKNSTESYENTLTDIIQELETYRTKCLLQKNGAKSEPLLEKFEEARGKLTKLLQPTTSPRELQNGGKSNLSKLISTPSSSTFLPQTLIDVSVSVAISVILTPNSKSSNVTSATNVLLQCIAAGMVSGRNNFNRAIISNCKKNDDTLRLLLLTLQTQHTSKDTEYWPLHLISNLLQYCTDSLTEQMLVSMVHFVMCHPTDTQFDQHWSKESKASEWYADSEVKVLEKRLQKALKESGNTDNSEEDLQKLVQNLRNRLAISRQLFFIGKIVTHSKCNPALLRGALRNGLTQASGGEIEVLMQALSKILRRVGKEKKEANVNAPNRSTCVSQWLSAVVDTNLGALITTSDSKPTSQVKKEVSASISQTQAILSLKEILGQVDGLIDCKKKQTKRAVRATTMEKVPLYGIEPLIF